MRDVTVTIRTVVIVLLAGFCLWCGYLVVASVLVGPGRCGAAGCILLQAPAPEPTTGGGDSGDANEPAVPQPSGQVTFGADNAPIKTVVLGSADRRSGFKYRLELTSKGAAIRTATFSEFDDRDPKYPEPLVFISPIPSADGQGQVLALSNTAIVFPRQRLQLPLDVLSWRSGGLERAEDGSQTAWFEAVIKRMDTGQPVLKLTKRYTIRRDSYLMQCELSVENLSDDEQKIRLELVGPGGLGREAFRSDMRKVVAGFRDPEGNIVSVRLDKRKLHRANRPEQRRLNLPGGGLLWVAAVNKYFAAILVPEPRQGKDFCDWLPQRQAVLYNPDGDRRADSGDENIALHLTLTPAILAPGGRTDYNFEMYIGPKDKGLFDGNPHYRALGFAQTIDFLACCCPASIINPLAFGILALMKWMYGFIGNYGLVIIILVFLVRLVMHPVTKRSQVAMNKMSKLAPMAEEIRKKYANNKAEMNRQLMELYREHGASPVLGFLPMLVQMPIWIALWSAVYASIDLRGAPFLPFWITDLSVPDALVRFSTVTVPLLGWRIESLNLLPILMGVAFYLQQKLMPSQASSQSTNPQLAQQQKIMMVMFPLMFPLFLYKAPSGVNLYIMASTFAGVIEQYYIRKHIQKREESGPQALVAATSKTGGKVKKKKPKPFYRF